ncbi:hypothetical protein [uncultured Rikenella sp.]|uniref:hypothetical protein n=1 Tax=uncultured Rikenella sp. TaxID=368003 RepID=UPI0026102CBB|nr:hypothetical protein [uncultured Rikenella sp.]
MPLGINRRDQHPAPGHRGSGEGALWVVGNGGYSWSSTVSVTDGMYLHFLVTWLYPSSTACRANGLQLRCLSE